MVDLKNSILEGDVDSFRRNLSLMQQKKLSEEQVTLVLSFINKVTDEVKKKEFLTALSDVVFGGVYVSAHDYISRVLCNRDQLMGVNEKGVMMCILP